MSIFKAGPNARYTFDLKDFIAVRPLRSFIHKKLNNLSTKAMGAMHFEYGCKGTKHFFTPTGKVAEAIGGKTYVLHLVSNVSRHVQRPLKRP